MTSISTQGGLLPVMTPTVTLRVDGVEVRVARGAMVLEAVHAASVALPSLCKPEARGPLGACRTCLIEVEGQGRLAAACHTPVAEGQSIRTTSERADRVRRGVLDLTIGMSEDGRGSRAGGATRDRARPRCVDLRTSRARTAR